ncbi:unnamed protein product [Nezara viridula]|uniref:Gamma-interferon-inducible lysosomal thiol reductase n=1 Tax=Nezara viridula TaxID=85310 RepID=A0A9P0H2E2_NEZVI|nr:unnamed protein product [Nezara viridula]
MRTSIYTKRLEQQIFSYHGCSLLLTCHRRLCFVQNFQRKCEASSSTMAVLFLLAALVGCVVARPSSENVTPVEVTLYYESLCYGCRMFVPNQLLPAYTDSKYRSLISKLTLVPYGWVWVKNATSHDYNCQHGESECDGNRLHACAIKYIPDQVTTLEYISCLDKQGPDNLTFASLQYPIDAKRNDDVAESAVQDFKKELCKAAGVANQTTYNFKTKRGQFESDGNRLHSCATKYIPDVLTTLNYISCLEKLEKHQQGYAPFEFGIPPKYPIDKCKNKLPAGLYPKIINCYRSDEGWELYEENKEKSKPLLPKAGTIPFPYVSFNDEHDDVLAQDAVDNFKSTLCKVTGVVDKACSL